jgi:hypothetical protein
VNSAVDSNLVPKILPPEAVPKLLFQNFSFWNSYLDFGGKTGPLPFSLPS